MPKLSFSTDNVRGGDTKFPTVKLGSNEYWRVVIAEAEPTYEWVHTLRKPKLSPVTGRLQMKEITLKDGDKKQIPDMEFVGTPICLGSFDILEDRGVDADHCPVCKAAMDYPDYFSAPERRFAVHVLKYGTQPGGSKVLTPLNMETKVWRMSENRYAKIVQVIEEFGGDAQKVDLVLGPCTNATYQNYEIAGSPNCAIMQSEENLKRAIETFQGSNAGDLSAYCGRKAERRFMEQDISEIVGRWQKAQGGGEAPAAPDFSGTLADSGSALLGGSTAVTPPPAAPTVDLSALDDTVGTPAASETPAQEPAAPAASTEAPATEEAPADKGPSFSFDSLISQLGAK